LAGWPHLKFCRRCCRHFPPVVSLLSQLIYCNVEGIQWIDDVRFVIASDKAKKTQPLKCVSKEQRMSIFALPYTYEEQASA
jgi:hypothetical protein